MEILPFLMIVLLMGGCTAFTKSEAVVNGDVVYGIPKDVEVFQNCEDYVITWLSANGFEDVQNRALNIKFVNSVELLHKGKLPKSGRVIGLYDNDTKTLYATSYYSGLRGMSKFGIDNDSAIIYKGIITHEVCHAYLYGLFYLSTSFQEFICANLEIDYYNAKYGDTLIKRAQKIVEKSKEPLSLEYFKNIDNYRDDFEKFQLSSYYWFNIEYGRDTSKLFNNWLGY